MKFFNRFNVCINYNIDMKTLFKYILFFCVSLSTTVTYTATLDVKLISYEDKKSYDGTAQCELEFSFTNNSWGTIYGLRIDTEVFDDRKSKVSSNMIMRHITPFAMIFGDVTSIRPGNSATAKSLTVNEKCQYIGEIFMTKVDQKNCNIRMMPEGAKCINIIRGSSDISHINLINKNDSTNSSNDQKNRAPINGIERGLR
jgi:hypothetical protein